MVKSTANRVALCATLNGSAVVCAAADGGSWAASRSS